jgi:protein-S-isoprenylcysteine O-methyltransferase Ste14
MGFDKRTIQRIRVPLGFAFAVVFGIFARPTAVSLAVGGAVAVVGLLIRAWASGHIHKARELAVSGPYAYTRNPLYLGSLILGVGFTVAAGVWWLALLFCLLFLGIYFPVMRVESEDMRNIFGGEFTEYEQNVPLIFPRLGAWNKRSANFDFQLYWQYREYRAAVGTLIAIGALAAKAYFVTQTL